MCSPITVQPDGVDALGAELAALAGELDHGAGLCRSTARSLTTALGGHEGWVAGAAATAWGSLTEVVAARTAAVATTLAAAAAAYRAADAARSASLSEGIGFRLPVEVAPR